MSCKRISTPSLVIMNNSMIRSLGMRWSKKIKEIMQNLNPLNVMFCDIKKFDIQNTVISNLLSQVKATKLSDKDLTRKISGDAKTARIEDRLEELKKPININEISDSNDDDDGDNGGDLNRTFDELRRPQPPQLPRRRDNSLTRRFNQVRYGPIAPP